MLTVIENVLSPQEVLQFNQALNNGNWQDGKQSAGSQAAQVKHNQQLDDSSDLAARLGNANK